MTPCPDCAKGDILPGEPTGSYLEEFQGAYFAPSPTGSSKRAVIYLTDAFGLPLKNCRIIADELARRLECDVWIPDYFKGRPLFPIEAMVIPDRAGIKLTAWDWFKFLFIIIPQIPAIISNRPSVVDKRLESFFALLKEKKKYDKIGAIGYCFGGATCVRLGSTDYVNSVIIAHPGTFTLNQVKAIKVPASWICAQEDIFFPDSLRRDSEAVFAARKDKEDFVDYEFKLYEGTAHGFATRPNLNLPEIKAAYEGALNQAVDWFQRTLNVV